MSISRLSTKNIAANSLISSNGKGFISWLELPLRVCVVLTTLLTALIVLFEIEKIEMIIAIFSIGVSIISHSLRLSSASKAMHPHLAFLKSDILEALDALGLAGAGTLVILYLLA